MRGARCGCWLVAVSLTLIFGCSEANPNDPFARQTDRMFWSLDPRGVPNLPRVDLEGVPVSVGIPKTFSTCPPALAIKNGVDRRRVEVPKIELPGHRLTGEAFCQQPDGSSLAYYCYFAAVPAPKPSSKSVLASLQGMLRGMCPEVRPLDHWNGEWMPSAQGPQREWSTVRAAGPQEFYWLSADQKQEEYRTVPGQLICFGLEEKDVLLLFCVRTPASLEATLGPEDLARWLAFFMEAKSEGR